MAKKKTKRKATKKKSAKKTRRKVMSTTDLSVKESSGSLAVATNLDAWGAPPELSSDDIVIPRLLVMQPTSSIVTNGGGNVNFGDIVENINETVMAAMGEELELIPIHLEKFLRVQNAEGELVRNEPFPATNKYKKEIVEEGETYKVFKVQRIYFLLADNIDRLPYYVDFKSASSARAGQEISTIMFLENRSQKLPPSGHTIYLTVVKDSNGKSNYAKLNQRMGRRTTDEELTKAFEWFNLLKDGSAVASEDNVE